MFSACRTPPAAGIPKYASRCSRSFHIRVATRSPLTSPADCNAPANCRERMCRSPRVERCRVPSGSTETTSTLQKSLEARSVISGTSSGDVIIVDFMATSRVRGRNGVHTDSQDRPGEICWEHAFSKQRGVPSIQPAIVRLGRGYGANYSPSFSAVRNADLNRPESNLTTFRFGSSRSCGSKGISVCSTEPAMTTVFALRNSRMPAPDSSRP